MSSATVNAPAQVSRLEDVGVRFDFDHLGRVVTPVLGRLRRIKASAWGLRHVDLSLEPGTGLALVGPTGSGKTTLLRVLADVIPPDEGTREIHGRIGSLLATDAGLASQLTGRENVELLGVLAGLSRAETRAGMEPLIERARLGDAFDRPVHTYSQGMRARLGLSVIQAIEPQVLLLDEVFEALDHEFRGVVEGLARDVRARGGVVVAAGPRPHRSGARLPAGGVAGGRPGARRGRVRRGRRGLPPRVGLDQPGAGGGAVVLASPGGDLPRPRGDPGVGQRAAARPTAAARAGPVRPRSSKPAPAHCARAPFSAASAPPGQTRTGTPSPSARVTVPCPPAVITSDASGIACA